MANRARRTREFLAQHPFCIFCGGTERAVTCDHVPSRQLFHLRHWPEGYEFPSCYRCNQATKDAEQVMALVSRVGPNPKNEVEHNELGRIMRAVRNNYPAVLSEMRPSREQVSEYHTKPWLPGLVQKGLAAPIPIALGGPLVTKCVEAFARKLFTALHYKETGKIIPPEGGILWRWFSNVQRLDNHMPDEITQMMTGRPVIQRTRRDLSDQFSYTYVRAEDAELTGYFATFRESFAMLGFVDFDAIELVSGITPQPVVLRPLGISARIAPA